MVTFQVKIVLYKYMLKQYQLFQHVFLQRSRSFKKALDRMKFIQNFILSNDFLKLLERFNFSDW